MEAGAPLPRDELVRTLSRGGGVSVSAIAASALVGEAARRHASSPTASVALGRALMGALLMAAPASADDTVQLQVRGDGPLGSLIAIADGTGRVRGYASNPAAHPPPREGRLQIAEAIGSGVLALVRRRAGWREPQHGVVPLTSSTVAQDLAHYLSSVEGAPAAVGLGVFLAPGGGVEAAGGFLVRALPGALDEEVEQVEANVQGFPGPGEMVRDGLDADAILERILDGVGSGERERIRPEFHCRCGRERVLRAVTLLGRDEMRRVARGDEPLEVRCEFCGERYVVGSSEVGALLADVPA